MHRALRRLFPGVDIPTPLESVYKYWEEGFMHHQRAGTHVTSFEVFDWAKRPFSGQELFLVGEAYHPLRGWIEGARRTARNALREGWGLDEVDDLEFKQEDELSEKHVHYGNIDWSLFP
ncbi:hypothetical protein AWC38_SpisGene14163 [Stylophora pistillata]|uniref:Amine oxidase domain-containing protein n=1 Tax=Stylophora pistillata TaxID=50429 RepID=A0A2B4RYP1_STYPI|nr:hypothetical protein AWC38_SpisGene14163 [Stylophora pistillata]